MSYRTSYRTELRYESSGQVSANKPEVAAQTWLGQIVRVDGELLTVRKPDNGLIGFRKHDPARLVVILEHMGVAVTVNDQFAILRAGITPAGSFGFSVQPDNGEPLGPCKTDQLPPDLTAEQLSARIRTHSGFSVGTSAWPLSAE
jgi:hypothetical protein